MNANNEMGNEQNFCCIFSRLWIYILFSFASFFFFPSILLYCCGYRLFPSVLYKPKNIIMKWEKKSTTGKSLKRKKKPKLKTNEPNNGKKKKLKRRRSRKKEKNNTNNAQNTTRHRIVYIHGVLHFWIVLNCERMQEIEMECIVNNDDDELKKKEEEEEDELETGLSLRRKRA